MEGYLEDLGLDALHAEYIERSLEKLSGQERASAARRLAELYARLLESSDSPQERERIELRAEALLAAIPQMEAEELRFSLARASFERSEAVLERWRLRATDERDADVALRRMRELMTIFGRVAGQAHERVQRLESREERASDADIALVERRLAEARERRSAAYYLAGWSARYVAEFGRDRDAAGVARRSFGWLLNAQPGAEPQTERVREGFFQFPHIARSAIAVGYCYALAGLEQRAMSWYELVENDERLPREIREQLPTRRFLALAALEDWSGMARALEATDDEDPDVLIRARLAAVEAMRALTSTQAEPAAAALRDRALARIVTLGELGQAVETVEVFGVQALDTSGFVSLLVRGLIAYQDARALHAAGDNPNGPTDDAGIRAEYTRIADELLGLLAERDADQFTDAVGSTLLVIGLCRFYSGELAAPAAVQGADDAASLFVRAAESAAPGSPAHADALWMAIAAYDAALSAKPAPTQGSAEEWAEKRTGLIDDFLTAFPDHERASGLVLRRAIERAGESPEAALALLLEIDSDEPGYETARRNAARIAYRQARDAPASVAAFREQRYLDLAEPLLALDRRRASDDADAANAAATTARRILGIALRMEVPDLARASRAIDALESMESLGLISTSDYADELAFRRAEYALAVGDVASAEAQLAQLAASDPELGAQGARLVYIHAARQWRRFRAADPGSAEAIEAAARVYRVGRGLVPAGGYTEGDLLDEASASLARNVADAARAVWQNAADGEARALGQSLYASLLSDRGDSRELLLGYVELASAAGEHEGALDAQRRLVAGLRPGSRDWFEARFVQFELLELVDIARLREALRQHRALYPDYGPEPWGDRIRRLAQRLGITEEASGG